VRWDGITLAEVVKTKLYGFFENAIPEASRMNNTEYSELLKKRYNHSGGSGKSGQYKTYINARSAEVEIYFSEPVPVEIYGEDAITLTWSMAARQIRAWEYEKAHGAPQASSVAEQWGKTHLCGSFYIEGHCEYLIEMTEDTVINGRAVKKCNPYCTSENKVRKIGTGGLWTGLSPKFCPKRKALAFEQRRANGELFENSEQLMDEGWRYAFRESSAPLISKVVHGHNEKEEDNAMARKLQFDAAITKDMKSAALDSFIDNIKMIDVKEITPSEKNFYEMSAIELLADDIEREGLKHNLVVVKDPSTGLYEVKSGHRRLAAIELLIKEKRIKSTKIPCIVDGEKTEAENEFDLIMLNATQRKYSDAELLSEYEHLSQILNKLKDEGKGLSGRIRDNIATILNISNGQVGKLDNIKHNAAPEVKKAVENGAMSISTANEVAKLTPEKQIEVVKSKPEISSAEVKQMQDKKPPVPKPRAEKASPKKEVAETFDELEEDDEILDDDWKDDEDTAEDRDEELTVNKRTFELSVNDVAALLTFLDEHSAEKDLGVAALYSKLNDFLVGV